LAGFGGLIGKKFEIMRNFGHSNPFAFKECVHLEFTYKVSVERRTVEDMLILQVLRQVDTIILTDILHCLRRQQPGMSTDAHGFKDMAAALEITGLRHRQVWQAVSC